MCYLHIPINSAFTTSSHVIDRLHQKMNNEKNKVELSSGRVLFHFDISSSVGTPLIKYLFDICIIGILAVRFSILSKRFISSH